MIDMTEIGIETVNYTPHDEIDHETDANPEIETAEGLVLTTIYGTRGTTPATETEKEEMNLLTLKSANERKAVSDLPLEVQAMSPKRYVHAQV